MPSSQKKLGSRRRAQSEAPVTASASADVVPLAVESFGPPNGGAVLAKVAADHEEETMVHARSRIPSIAFAALCGLAARRADAATSAENDRGASLDADDNDVGVPDEGEGGRFVATVLPGVPWGNSTPIADGHGSWISLAPDGFIDVSSSDHRLPKPEDLPARIVCKGQRTGRVVFRGERVGKAQCPDIGHAACVGIWGVGAGAAAGAAGGLIALGCGPAAPACVVGWGAAAGGLVTAAPISVDPASGWTSVIQTPAQPAQPPPVTTPAPADPPALIHEPDPPDNGAEPSSGGDDEPVTCGPDDDRGSSSDEGGE